MSQKISRRTRRRRQSIRESWAEVERRQIAQANWSDFDCVNAVKSFEDAARAILSPFEHATGPVWSPELTRIMRETPIYDQGDTGASFGYCIAAMLDRLKDARGLCPNCGGGSVRNVWGMTNDDAECIDCGAIFNSFERMREMDRLSDKGDR